MTNAAYEKAESVFNMYFKDRSHLTYMYQSGTLNISKQVQFILENLFNDTLDDVDFELYSFDINYYYRLFLKVKEQSKPIHGDFYPDIRQRYFDLLNCEPIENSDEPLRDTHIAWMLKKLSDDDMSETKKQRWLGFIQGCMAYRGLLNVNEERDATRDVFKGK
jgi:hypothetical protein